MKEKHGGNTQLDLIIIKIYLNCFLSFSKLKRKTIKRTNEIHYVCIGEQREIS